MSITLTIIVALFAAFALAGVTAGVTVPYVRAIMRKPPTPNTKCDIALQMLGWLALIALHGYRHPQYVWWYVAAGICWLGLTVALWCSTPPAGRPRT